MLVYPHFYTWLCSILSIVWWSTLSYFYISWSQGNSWPSQWLWWIMPGTVHCTEYLMGCLKWKMALISQFKTPFAKKKWQVRSNLMFNHNFLNRRFLNFMLCWKSGQDYILMRNSANLWWLCSTNKILKDCT